MYLVSTNTEVQVLVDKVIAFPQQRRKRFYGMPSVFVRDQGSTNPGPCTVSNVRICCVEIKLLLLGVPQHIRLEVAVTYDIKSKLL